jgi:cystathionine gamma-synthase
MTDGTRDLTGLDDGLGTQAVHGGTARRKPFSAISTPIVQTATYTFADTSELIAYMERKFNHGGGDRVEYGRYGNPTVEAVESKIAALSRADAALLYASGMSAVTSVLLTLLRPGLHIVLTDDCYRHTHDFCLSFLARYGIESTIVPMGDYAAMEAAIIPRKTRLILTESPTNPYLRIADLGRVAALGRQYGALTMIDSTFATPINQRPLDWGIDLVMHSATKYLAGHNDLLAGVVVGRRERIDALRESRGLLGGVVDPQNAYLLERGLKTLALRVRQQNHSAQIVAAYLETHPKSSASGILDWLRTRIMPSLPSRCAVAAASSPLKCAATWSRPAPSSIICASPTSPPAWAGSRA